MATLFRIGELPPFTLWAGQTLRFTVKPRTGETPVSMTLAPELQPAVKWRGDTGEFEFTASEQQRQAFKVLFSAQGEHGLDEQAVTITPLPRLPSHYRLLSRQRTPPNPESVNYLQVTVAELGAARLNNEQRASTRGITLSGMHVVLAKGHPNGLWERFCQGNQYDIATLSIFADQVVIRSPVKLPQTEVLIQARQLRFENAEGQDRACIDTTPLAYKAGANQLQDGADGGNAGHVTLKLGSFSADATSPCFILRGAKGQKAGDGKTGDGPPGRKPTFDVDTELVTWPTPRWREYEGYFASKEQLDEIKAKAVYVEFWLADWLNGNGYKPIARFTNTPFWGSPHWPQDGNPGQAAGRPGNGGNGGLLRSTMPGLEPYYDPAQSHGEPGDPGTAPLSAPGQEPKQAVHARLYRAHWLGMLRIWVDIYARHEVKDGTVPPSPTAGPGASGRLEYFTEPWIHPLIVQAVLSYCRDLCLTGNDALAADLLKEHRAQLTDRTLTSEAELELSAARGALTPLLQRLENNRDYFDNAAGWYPMLSLEASERLLRREVEHSLRAMYLAYWIEQRWQQGALTAAALDEAARKLEADADLAADTLQSLQSSLPELELRAVTLKQKLTDSETRLEELTRRLLEQAQGDLTRQHALKLGAHVLAGLLQVVPVAQPYLGVAGKGLSILGDLDLENPFETTGKLGELLGEFGATQLSKKVEQLQKILEEGEEEAKEGGEKKKDTPKQKRARKLAARLSSVADNLAPGIANFNKGLEQLKVTDEERETRLALLQAQSPEFQELTECISELGEEVESVVGELSSAQEQIAECYTAISQGLLGIDKVNRQREATLKKLDHELLASIRGLRTRALERLNRYQYYLAKAFEHRAVKPLEVDYNLAKLVGRMVEMLAGEDGILTPEQFNKLKSVYEESLHEMYDQWVKLLQDRPPELENNHNPYHLTKEQLAELNTHGEVTINLMELGLLPYQAQDLRLTHVGVLPDRDPQGRLLGLAISGAAESVIFSFVHTGRSIVRSDKELFVFDTTASGGQGYMTWASTYKSVNDKVEDQRISLSMQALFKMLLGLGDGKPDDKVTTHFAKPGAWADLVIKRQVVPPGNDFQIDKLVITYSYTWRTAPDHECMLDLRVEKGLRPLVTCQQDDRKEDHRGDFVRIYNKGTRLVLQAPAELAGSRFVNWWGVDINANTPHPMLGSEPTLTLPLDRNWRVYLRYESTTDHGSPSKHELIEADHRRMAPLKAG